MQSSKKPVRIAHLVLRIAVLTLACSACADDDESSAIGSRDGGTRCRTLTAYRDRDGDGRGAGDAGKDVCIGEPAPAGFAFDGNDCDDLDPQRSAGFYERFADQIDSDCNGADDPSPTEPCTCDWVAPNESPALPTVCEQHFDPDDAVAAVAAAHAQRRCTGGHDLGFAFAIQCKSDCFGVPIYFSVANRGDTRSPPARVRLVGAFRAGPPLAPLMIEPLAPGQVSALIEVLATGTYRLQIEPGDGECDTTNDELEFDAYDRHCGFLP